MNPVVEQALQAMVDNDRELWMNLFTPTASLSDDGHPEDLAQWSDREVFSRKKVAAGDGGSLGYFKSVDRVEENGCCVYGVFFSARWGDMHVFSRFVVRDGKIDRLEVGQASEPA